MLNVDIKVKNKWCATNLTTFFLTASEMVS